MGKKHHKDKHVPAGIPETDLPDPTPVETDPAPTDTGEASDDGMPVPDDDDDDGFST